MSTDQPTSEAVSTTEEIVSDSTTFQPTTEEDTTPVYTTTNIETTEEKTDTSTELPETTTGIKRKKILTFQLKQSYSKWINFSLVDFILLFLRMA